MGSPKVFVGALTKPRTGATGYIGGDAFFQINQAHPEWEFTALVRNKQKGELVTSKYPNTKLVYGDLDTAEILEEEAKKADIVYHFADCDHVASSQAIAKGIAAHTPDRPGYWIHTSGTGILTFEDLGNSTFGDLRTKEYNDWDGIGEVTSLPDEAFHRDVDKIVLGVGENAADRVKTAIVCPPTIYGPGRGPGNTRSNQIYNLTKYVLKRRKGLQVGKGENIWHEVHVHDLSDLFLLLGEAAAAGSGKATWGKEGYYFVENGSFVWGDVEKAMAQIAFEKGLIPTPEVDILDGKQAKELYSSGPFSWGTNSRAHAIRARKLLGWNPHRPAARELLPEIVDLEAKALNLERSK
ncbi:hypothetical protein ACO22_05672 [Paracoccidioides brasiliensis]|uniref:NmrA-like domain-containing protein n=1 Tax=Paracoccidioides brasiliensis TaxID=121759 RepID=A0A1D2J9K3_PARBR|nr:hypothetical protein ACO22_05672 [Paracoccidioides brasiliensis]